MSRGAGRCMRAVLAALDASAKGRLNRVDLERKLVDEKGFDPSNLLRAVKSLRWRNEVIFLDRRRKSESFVELVPKPAPVPEGVLAELLKEVTEKGEIRVTRSRKIAAGDSAKTVGEPRRTPPVE